MLLRTRLTIAVLGLLALGLVGMAVATFEATRDFAGERAKRKLAQAGDAVVSLLAEERPLGSLTLGDDRLMKAAVLDGGVPSFFQVRTADGRVADALALDGEPAAADLADLVRRIPAEAPVVGRVDGERGGVEDWDIRGSRLADGRILIVGLRTAEFDDLVGRLAGVETVVTLCVLGGITLVARRTLRRVMRPLDEIAVTARAIGRGDLAQRVGEGDERTEVGRLRLALNEMLGQIESAFREREASEERLRRFVADASHELRTPIASIRGYAELFRRGAASRPDDLAKAMDRIESEGTRMGSLVEEMLLLARLDEGRPLEMRPVDLAVLAADAVADARAREPDRPLTLECDGEVPVLGDAPRLRQVLANLMSNVLHHTPGGTPAVVRVGTTAGHAVIEVADQGPGMTEEQSAHVFERFFRADSSRSRDHGGAGLGLSIVAAITAAHGGTASVTAREGKGATFSVRIPCPAPVSRAPGHAPADPGEVLTPARADRHG
ncbi:sensor histidine kinase [Planomonospora venezuelensis]|uniref:histidine kinase n=1 Tax=Planomonospora venezuelensis TaxID=1999 RepID=A0A841D214_PLAVE|nr:HAMP domain-containing sensor histidine kinase [Planomonospora venezuelensis]MBB5962438.1 two-component system OmpR family sensor kinase [Planomonospora venezuelensis]GIN00820.1 two-component sensor histidine kinase [Planomonospora venezuelensis]